MTQNFRQFYSDIRGEKAAAEMEKSLGDYTKEAAIVPTVIQKTAHGARGMDLFSALLEDRIIYVTGGVNMQMADLITAQLLYLEKTDPNKPIELYINSPGGSVSAGKAIMDTMNFIKPPVHTLATGMAASMGSIILSAGEPGHRTALANAEIMVHQPLIGGAGRSQQTEVEITAESLKDTRVEMTARYTLWMGLDPYNRDDLQLAHDLIERDNYLSPIEAKALGLIDDIAYSREPEKDLHPLKAAEHKLNRHLQEQKLTKIFNSINDPEISAYNQFKQTIAKIIKRRQELGISNDNNKWGQDSKGPAANGPQ